MILSIVIPCYNQGEYLSDALMSISQIDHTYDCEIIVVNDGSTEPATLEVLGCISDNNTVVINQNNQGLAAARNNGIAIAKGKYIIPLDSDNKIAQGYMVEAISILDNNPLIDVVYGNPFLFGTESGPRVVGGFNFSKILSVNYIDACAVYRREVWERTGGYDGSMPSMGNEDWEMWIHIYLLGGKFKYLDKTCFQYRVMANSMSVTTTRPGFEANKNYIHKKHALGIIKYLQAYSEKLEKIKEEYSKSEQQNRYYNNNKIRTAVKLLLGKYL